MNFLASAKIRRKDYSSLRNTSRILSRIENTIQKPTRRILYRKIKEETFRCCVDCSKAPMKILFRKHFQPENVEYKHNPGCANFNNPKLK